MFWISTDKAIPAFDNQIVQVKVADFFQIISQKDIIITKNKFGIL